MNLLGIYEDNHVHKLRPLFEDKRPSDLYDNHKLNNDVLNKWITNFWYFDYIPLIMKLIAYINKGDHTFYIRLMSEIDDLFLHEALGLDSHITYHRYKFYLVVHYKQNLKKKE